MDNPNRNLALFFFALAGVSLLLLGAGVSRIQVSVPELLEPEESAAPVSFSQHWIVIIYLAVLGIVFLWALISREGRKRIIMFVLLVGAATILLQLFITTPEELSTLTPTPTLQLLRSTPLSPELAGSNSNNQLAQDDSVPLPGWLLPSTGIVLAVLVLVGIGYFYLRLIPPKDQFLTEAISEQVQAAQQALQSGDEFKDVIMRCYAQMSAAVRQASRVDRSISTTPREFEMLITTKGFPVQPIRSLTRIFEKVRYSNLQPDDRDQELALSSLQEIQDYCREILGVNT